MPAIRPYLRMVVPKTDHYLLLAGERPALEAQSIRSETQLVTEDMLPLLERVRPRYSRVAKGWMREGSRAHVIVEDDRLLAIGWMHPAPTMRTICADFFPLHVGETLSFGDWVSPDARGRGLQKILLANKMGLGAADPSCTRIIGIILPDNIPSIRSVEKLGWTQVGSMEVRHVLKLYRAHRVDDPADLPGR